MSTVRGVVLALLFALSWVGSARAQDVTLESVLAEFAKVSALSAHFREEKRMALLSVPLISEGDIYYERPRRLARHTKVPAASSVVLDGAELSFGDAQHRESMGVDAHPALRVLVDTFVSVLSGAKERLLAMADVKLEKVGARGFKILVTPKEPNVLKLVKSMTFEGEGSALTKMELLDANGDRSVTTFSSVKPQAAFSPDQVKRLFRVGS
jgi:outer membrane lipoprotein-sorting protein